MGTVKILNIVRGCLRACLYLYIFNGSKPKLLLLLQFVVFDAAVLI